MKITKHSHKQLYKQPQVLKRLEELMNNHSTGSAMRADVNARRAGKAFLARDGKVIVGWAFVSRRRRDAALQIGVFVDPKFRNKGIGSKLTVKAKEHALKKKKRLYYSPCSGFAERMYLKNKLARGWYDWV
jgi:GNAT superfamily N-acetyltransferase